MVKKKKYHRKLILLLCIFLIINYITIPAYAEADPMGEAFPKLNKLLNYDATSSAKFLNGSRYYLDVKEGKIIDPPPILNNIANTIFQGIMGFVILLIYFVILSFKIKIFDDFSGILETVIKPIKIVIFDQWLITAILIFAFWMLLSLYFTSKRTNIYKNIISAAIIIGIAVAFLSKPTLFLNKMNDISQYMCNEIVEGSFNKNYQAASTDQALVTLGNQIWETMVEKPWMLLEFGSETEAKENMNEILKYDSNDESRIDLAEDLADNNPLFTQEYSYKRLGFVIFYFFAILPMLLVLLVIAGLNIGFQFMVMFFALWAPVVFILSILPSFGMNTFLSWFSREAGFFIMKIALTMFMAILFVFHNEIFNLNNKYGFILVILIQTISTIMVILMRKKIFGFATSIQYGQNGIKRSIKSKTPVVNQAKRDARKIGRAASAVASPVGWAVSKAGAAAMIPAAAVAHPVSIAVNKAYETGANMYEQGANTARNFKGNLSRQIKNRKIAKEYLWEKYTYEKSVSDQEAKAQSKKLGREVSPSYNSFVKEKMNLQKMNAKVFSNREINAVAKEIQHIKDHGGSVEDIFKTIKNPKKDMTKEVQRPSNINMHKDVQNNENVDVNAGSNIKFNNQTNSEIDMNKMARAFLARQFELNKNSADYKASERAKMMGISQKPEYDEYTKKVIGRMKKRHNRFSKDEIGKIQTYLEYMQTQGADLNDYMQNMGSMNVAKVLSRFDIDNETTNKESHQKQVSKFNIKDINKKGNEEIEQTSNAYKEKNDDTVFYEDKEVKLIENDSVDGDMKNFMEQESKEHMEPMDEHEIVSRFDIDNETTNKESNLKQIPKFNSDDVEKNTDEVTKQTISDAYKENYTDTVSYKDKEVKPIQTDSVEMKNFMEQVSKEHMGPMDAYETLSRIDTDETTNNESNSKQIPKFNIEDVNKNADEETKQTTSNNYKANYTGPVSYEDKEVKPIQSDSVEMKNFMEQVSKEHMGPMDAYETLSRIDTDETTNNESNSKQIPKFNIEDVNKNADEETKQTTSNNYKANYTGPVSYEDKEVKPIQSDSVDMKNFMDQVNKGQKELADKIDVVQKKDIDDKKLDKVLDHELEEKVLMDDLRTRIEKMNKEFNNQFKTNQTEEFFENIIKKYGIDKVSGAVKEMKKHKSKENASARLLKTLKKKENSQREIPLK